MDGGGHDGGVEWYRDLLHVGSSSKKVAFGGRGGTMVWFKAVSGASGRQRIMAQSNEQGFSTIYNKQSHDHP